MEDRLTKGATVPINGICREPAGRTVSAGGFGGVLFRYPQLGYGLLTGAAGAVMAVCFGYPLLNILKFATDYPEMSGRHFQEILLDPKGYYLWVFVHTFKVAAVVTGICLLLGYPMAALLLHAGGRWQHLLMICIVLPFWTSVLVRTYAWMVLLGRRGVVNDALLGLGLVDQPIQLLFNTTGTVIGMTHIMLPYMIFPLYSVMKNIDPQLVPAAYSLGAGPRQAFARVFLPLSMPGVFGGSLLVFIISLGFFITPALMGGQQDLMVSVLIERRVMDLLQWGQSAALSLALLATTLLLVTLVSRFMRVEELFGRR